MSRRDFACRLGAALALALAAVPAAGLVVAPPTIQSLIEGPTWRLTRLGSKAGDTLVGTSRAPTVRFASGRVEGNSGCNTFGGGYEFEPGRLVIGSVRSTTMACIGNAMEIEAAFTRAFSGMLAVELEAGALTLTTTSGEVLVFRAEAAPRLADVTWTVTAFNNGRQAVVTPIIGIALTLRFGEGTLQGQAGCNAFHASADVDGSVIRIGAPVKTYKVCAGQGVMEQERAFLAALQLATTWLIRGDRLELRLASGERALTARQGEK